MLGDRIVETARIGDIICYQSYGGAKTWGKVIDIEMVQPTDIYNRIIKDKPKYKRLKIDRKYYKSYYDKHLTGRTSGLCWFGGNYNYPVKNCTLKTGWL